MRQHPLTWSLIFINLAVFLLIFSMPQEMRDEALEKYSLSADTKFEVWRWVSSMFIHASASHLFFNLLGLYFFGKILEELVERSWWLSVYFVSGLLGGLAFIFTNASPVVGASGAIFGLLGTVMFLAPSRIVHLYVIPLPLGIIAVMYVLFETFVAVFTPAEAAGIATLAHIGGIITGVIFAFAYNPKKSIEGFIVLLISLLLLFFLGPVFAVIAGVGQLILEIMDTVIGFFLYNAANLLSFIWR